MLNILLIIYFGLSCTYALDHRVLVDQDSLEQDFSHGGPIVSVNERIHNTLESQKAFNKSLSQSTKGVVKNVGVIDTGFMSHHDQLEGRMLEGYNAVWPRRDTEVEVDVDFSEIPDGEKEQIISNYNHGTNMAGIIAQVTGDVSEARKIKIIPLTVGVTPLKDLDVLINALNFLAKRPDVNVVSISLDLPVIFYAEPPRLPLFKEALLNVINANKLLVLAALNRKSAYMGPRIDPFVQFVLSYEAKGRVIMVGATTRDELSGKEYIAPYSNRAGALSSCFISAPGSNIRCAACLTKDGIKSNKAMVVASGTSHATAVVSGALIYLINQFPTLTIDDIKEVVFQSACKRAAKIYGQGFLNIEKARLLAATRMIHVRNKKFYNSEGLICSRKSNSHSNTKGATYQDQEKKAFAKEVGSTFRGTYSLKGL